MRSHMLNILYDRSWEVIYTEGDLSLLNKTLPGKPKVLNSMISAAESLGKTFDFTRVDLYLIDNKAFLGEVTFTPHRGGYATPMKDLTSNLLLSNPWRMYNLELIQAYWLHIKKLKKHNK